MEKGLTEEEISLIIENSLAEVNNSRQPEIIKKKYLEKGGIISQLLQQIVQENNLEKKRNLVV